MRTMKTAWTDWFKRAKQVKKEKAIKDVDIAAVVGGIGRGQVNHWLLGRREPKLSQFFALCEALGADPRQVLFGESKQETPPQTQKKDYGVSQPVINLAGRISALPPSERKKILDFVAGKEVEGDMGNANHTRAANGS